MPQDPLHEENGEQSFSFLAAAVRLRSPFQLLFNWKFRRFHNPLCFFNFEFYFIMYAKINTREKEMELSAVEND